MFAVLFAVGTSSALAKLSMTFAESGAGAGQVERPLGVAVDQSSGDVYVADHNNFRVDKFGPAGEFLMAWGYGVADGFTPALQTCGPEANPPTISCFAGSHPAGAGAVAPASIAVDQSSGDVYVSDFNARRVTKFSPSGEFLLMFGKEVNTTSGTLHPDLCTAADLAAAGTCGEGAAGTGPGEFSEGNPNALTVDATGNVWVGDQDRLEEFNSSGEYISQVAIGGGGRTLALAVDPAGDFYVKSESLPGIQKLEAATGTLLETLDASGSPQSVALGPSGNVYVGDSPSTEPSRVMVFDPSGAQIEQFGSEQILDSEVLVLAVGDVAKSVYVAGVSGTGESSAQLLPLPEPGPLIENQHVEELNPVTVTLTAGLNPEGHATTYHFEYGTTESYGESTAVATLPGSGFEEEAVTANLAGLTPETIYHFRLVAEDSLGRVSKGPDTTFTTLPTVGIDAQWTTEVAATSVTFNAELNPLGPPATWWVEYGTSESYGTTLPEESLAAGAGDVAVSSHVASLLPDVTYHYRFVARDERDGVVYTAHGQDRSFTTQGVFGGLTLPDGRAWEMVTPPDKHGANLEPISEQGVAQASADGGAMTYLATAPTEAEPRGNANKVQVLSKRGSEGWVSQDIATPHHTASGQPTGQGFEYRFFTPTLSQALVEPQGEFTPLSPELSPQATERTIYVRDDASGTYRALVTAANVPPGTEFGADPELLEFVGATPDLSHVILTSRLALTATPAPNGGLYEWADGQLQLISVLPASEGGAAASGATFGLDNGTASHRVARHAISDDGSRIVWSDQEGHLYLRDTAKEETVLLDAVQPGASGGTSPETRFQTASNDGSRVFFTDTQRLTSDAGASEGKPDLYECEMVESGGELRCELSDLTPLSAGKPAAVQGIVPGASEDGSSIYFVANGVLASGAAPGACKGAGEASSPGATCNLYLSHAGTITLVAVLSDVDSADWSGRGFSLPGLTASVSSSGRWLAFMSQRPLTGYDNRDAISGEPDEEVYLYDAAGPSLVCASCNPTGARPHGVEYGHNGNVAEPNLPLAGGDRVWDGSTWLAANIPGWTAYSLGHALYRSRDLSAAGRLFFNSSDALVPQDSNGTEDVYQYEPPGVGDCSTASSTFSQRSGGCVSLISSGTSKEESAFLDASESGDDAFFLTAAKLSSQDSDTALDVYDAHVCSAASPCPSPPPSPSTPSCEGEACQSPAAPPSDVTPGSFGYQGPGNVRKPGKAKKRKHHKHKKKSHRRHSKRMAGPGHGSQK